MLVLPLEGRSQKLAMKKSGRADMETLFFICNAFDDITRLERGVSTDSPAASRKIFLLCKAVGQAGIRSIVISMGRGKQDGSGRFFQCKLLRVNGVLVIYLPFVNIPIFSELLSLFSLVPIIWRMRNRRGEKAAIFYNRMPAYLFALILVKALHFITILDLEDGETGLKSGFLSTAKSRVLAYVFDALCSNGVLLACGSLSGMTRIRPSLCYYGTAISDLDSVKWCNPCVTVLMGGTIDADTGAELLINTIDQLRRESPPWAQQLRFEVTGKGACLEELKNLAAGSGIPQVIVHGRTTDREYRAVLNRCDVGLALKPNKGMLANTTFPSKVVELSAAGLLVITTDISDVRRVLGDGALYLTLDEPQALVDLLEYVVKDRSSAQKCAQLGVRNVNEVCSPWAAGRMVSEFIFGNRR